MLKVLQALNLNNGNGDLITINQVLIDTATEKLAAVGNCDGSIYWIVGHGYKNNRYYAFKLSASGLASAVTSPVGMIMGESTLSGSSEARGYLKFASNGKKLGAVVYSFLKNTVQLLDFNFNTGQITNPVTDIEYPDDNTVLDPVYGCSFSPDNSKFYVSFWSEARKVLQYDLYKADIPGSKINVASGFGGTVMGLGALQNGSDGKMYITVPGSNSMDVINNPNNPGITCDYIPSYQNLGAAYGKIGLPNFPENFLSPVGEQTFNIPYKLTGCPGDTISAVQPFGNPTLTIIPDTGVYYNIDGTIVFFAPKTTTTYTATATNNCETKDSITFTIQINTPVADFIFNPTDPSPADLQITLANQSINAQSYSWYDADTRFLSAATDYKMPHPGLGNFCYKLVAKDSMGCADTATKCITIEKYSIVFIPSTFSPNSDGINDEFRVYGPYKELEEFSVFNRYGERVFYTNNRFRGWTGQANNKPCDVGTYYYLIRFVNGSGKKETRKGDVLLLR